MNTQNFTHEGGFPFDQDKLKRMQDSYSIFNAFGALVGTNLAIIKGCVVTGTQVSDGYVWINGELLPFQGGALGTNVIIEQTIINEQFQNGVLNDVYSIRTAKFGTSATQYAWANFVRAYPMSSAVFLNEIRMYAGSVASIPWGWKLCDGTQGTENLKGRFIVGLDPADADYNAVGKVGGEKRVTLSTSQMPSHQHKQGSESLYSLYGGGAAIGSRTYPEGTHMSYDSQLTEAVGGGLPHENRPPYYTLAFIQFKGV